MKLGCVAVVVPEFSELLRLTTVSVEKDMVDGYAGENFGGGIDHFTVGVYVGDFKSTVIMNEAKENHSAGWYEDFDTKNRVNYLSIVTFFEPDLVRGMNQKNLKDKIIEEIFKIFNNFDIETPETFKVEELFLFLKKSFGKLN